MKMKNLFLSIKINLVTLLIFTALTTCITQTSLAQVVFPNVRVNDVITGDQSPRGNKAVAVLGDTVYVVWDDGRFSNINYVYFAKSTNGGASFSPSVRIYSPASVDSSHVYPTIAVDDFGVIYIAWAAIFWPGAGNPIVADILFTKSVNGGVSFQPPIRITTAGFGFYFIPSLAVKGSNVYISYSDISAFPLTNYYFVRSINGGNSFETPIQLNNINCIEPLKDG